MASEGPKALRELRDTLRTPIPDLDTFVFLLSSTLQALELDHTSVASGDLPPGEVLRAIQRYLPSIQVQLLTTAIPTFLHALDGPKNTLLETLFVPLRQPDGLTTRRAIALTSYLTLPTLLSSNNPSQSALPLQSREFILSTLQTLAESYSIDELYWSVFSTTSGGSEGKKEGWRTLPWEEAVKSVVGLPGKTANAVGRWKGDGWKGDVPVGLIPRLYYDRLVVRFEGLLYEVSQNQTSEPEPLRLVIQRLASNGLLMTPPSREANPTPSFLSPMMHSLLSHLQPPSTCPFPAYPSTFLPSLLLPLAASTLATFVESLLQHLTFLLIDSNSLPLQPESPDERIRRAVIVLSAIIGSTQVGGEAWDAMLRTVEGGKNARTPMMDEQHARARVIVAWIGTQGDKASTVFLDQIMDSWTDTKHIKYALYARQFSLSHILLLALNLLPPFHPHLIRLSHRPGFLSAMQSYLSHPDGKIRRLGMLVAEIVSELTIRESDDQGMPSQQDELDELKAGLELDDETGEPKTRAPKSNGAKRLRFGGGMWDGAGDGQEECRWLRKALSVRDDRVILADDPTGEAWLLGWTKQPIIQDEKATPLNESQPTRGRRPSPKPKAKAAPKYKPKIVMLDDDQLADPLSGYTDHSPSSSRSPSPTPSYLEEIAADPSLALDATQKKKIARPVYMQQLIDLLKKREEPDEIEMALKWGEGLVRAKRSFGTELQENAIPCAAMTIALNDLFQIEGFNEKRQGLLNALVACSPRNVPPYLIEQYFIGQYSLQQKSVILTAIAMGARELAGLSTFGVQNVSKRLDFPTKTLPPALHRKYIGPGDMTTSEPDQIELVANGIRDLLISKGANRGEETMPELAREKRLRVGTSRRTLAAEVGSLSERQMATKQSVQTAPHPPVAPFKDVAAEYFVMPLINRFWQHFQETSTRQAKALHSGTRYRGAGTGMILSPLALEKFLMTLSLLLHAGRHSPLFLAVLSPEALELAVTIGTRHIAQPNISGEEVDEGSKQEAQVVDAALELALVCLDASVDLDSGRTLAMEKANLVLAVGEWAQGVFELESGGDEVAAGQGGAREGRIRASAAGVVVKVAEIGEKWSRLGLLR